MLARSKFAVSIVQAVMDASNPVERALLIAALVALVPSLAFDACGNFVVSHVFRSKNRAPSMSEANAVAAAMRGAMRNLACDKFGSNVVELVIGVRSIHDVTNPLDPSS